MTSGRVGSSALLGLFLIGMTLILIGRLSITETEIDAATAQRAADKKRDHIDDGRPFVRTSSLAFVVTHDVRVSNRHTRQKRNNKERT